MRRRDPWNLNIHYDAVLAARVPPGARSVLDVGCGDGFLAARLAERVPTVVGLDIDEAVLDRARTRFPALNIRWRRDDALTAALPEAPFDAVVSNAAFHHFDDPQAALARLGSLLRPGGVLAVVTFARPTPRDLPWVAATGLLRRMAIRAHRHRFWMHTAPICWPPSSTIRELNDIASRTLPGARLRRLLMGWILLEWQAEA
jgi:SAM-dependent methyltransferase